MLRVFPGEYLDVRAQSVIDQARDGNRRAQTARKLLFRSDSKMKNANSRKPHNAVFDTMRLLERAHIHFSIKCNRPDAVTFVAVIVGERIEIDVFEDDHIEITRFRSNEDIEGGRELLVQIVNAHLRENYPEERSNLAAK